jgi:hypothetical protein
MITSGEVILQVFKEREKRGQALLQYSRILGIVSGHTSWHRGEARHGFEKELEIPVVGFPLTASRQTLAGQQEGIHVTSQVRQ